MRADVIRFLLADPSDVSGLQRAIRDGVVDPRQIVAVIGKTHGNGLVNDYTRGYLAQSLSLAIGEATGESPAVVRERIPFIFSGGVEGVLSPHYVVFSVGSDAAPPTGKALAVGVAFAPATAAAVSSICRCRPISSGFNTGVKATPTASALPVGGAASAPTVKTT